MPEPLNYEPRDRSRPKRAKSWLPGSAVIVLLGFVFSVAAWGLSSYADQGLLPDERQRLIVLTPAAVISTLAGAILLLKQRQPLLLGLCIINCLLLGLAIRNVGWDRLWRWP